MHRSLRLRRNALESLPPHEAHEVASIERRYGPSLRFLQA